MTNTHTAIGWTERTWNPVVGCEKVSQGCKHCYAKTLHDMRHKAYRAGKMQNVQQYAKEFEDVQLMYDRLTAPLSWRKGSLIFVNSMSDLFHDAVPDEFIDQVFAVMALAHHHTFQLLTKRPERMRAYISNAAFSTNVGTSTNLLMDSLRGRSYEQGIAALSELMLWFEDPNALPGDRANAVKLKSPALPNVWLGVSVELQQEADQRIPELLRTPAAVHFLSMEPLLGPVSLDAFLPFIAGSGAAPIECEHGYDQCPMCDRGVDWVIVGGESGKRCRAMDLDWARAIRDDCSAAHVPLFVKQLGGHPDSRSHDKAVLDGHLWTQMPRQRR